MSNGAEETDLARLSASETADLIRTKTVSAEEVTRAAIERIDERNPTLNAVVHLDADGALRAAAEVDRKIASGIEVGRLAGVPTLVKDLYGFVPGWPATNGGVPALRGSSTPEGLWSGYPKRLSDADAILLGMTNSPAFGYRGITDNALFGPTNNPFDVTRNPGGSSGGSAAAVADGLVPIASASDAGGSIRIPAAWTSTFGFQASSGRVPLVVRPNAFHLGTFLHEGVISRTVEDSAVVLDLLQGYDPRDPFSLPETIDFTSTLGSGVQGMRIAFTTDYGGFPVDQGVARLVAEAVGAFEQLGAHVETIDFPLPAGHEELSDMWLRSLASLVWSDIDAAAALGIDLYADNGIAPVIADRVREFERSGATDVIRDRALRTRVLDSFIGVFDRYDLIVGPTLSALPVKNGSERDTQGPSSVDGRAVDPLIGWCPTYLTNFSGNPSATVPAGLCEGLPVGLMIIGRRFGDLDVMAASAAFERARPWDANYAVPAARLDSI